jgi:alpha-L-rhamnosidase
MLCMHDAWEDCPSREQRQWLGDATVENLVGHAAFGPSVAPLNAKFLLQAAESQRPDGLTQMFAPGDHRTDGLLIPDWTLQWILNAGDHYRLTGDQATIETILPSILKALAWFERLFDAHGLVANMPHWHFMDWAGLGREGEACALNAQLSGAYDVAAGLCAALGWEREASRLRGLAKRIAASLNDRHWDERRGVWVDVVDPRSGKQEPKVSQHANAAMALWCAPPKDRVRRALDRITDSKRLTFTKAAPIVPTGDPLDPEHGVVLANTFYAHFVYEALCAHGRLSEALRMMRERFGPMLARGASTLWESFEPTASLCHGFSASPTWQLSRRVLGVNAGAPGFTAIEVSPDIADLDHAEGVVPTSGGDIEVKLRRDGTGFVAQVRAPVATALNFTDSPGARLKKFEAKGGGAHEAHYEAIGTNK